MRRRTRIRRREDEDEEGERGGGMMRRRTRRKVERVKEINPQCIYYCRKHGVEFRRQITGRESR